MLMVMLNTKTHDAVLNVVKLYSTPYGNLYGTRCTGKYFQES